VCVYVCVRVYVCECVFVRTRGRKSEREDMRERQSVRESVSGNVLGYQDTAKAYVEPSYFVW